MLRPAAVALALLVAGCGGSCDGAPRSDGAAYNVSPSPRGRRADRAAIAVEAAPAAAEGTESGEVVRGTDEVEGPPAILLGRVLRADGSPATGVRVRLVAGFEGWDLECDSRQGGAFGWDEPPDGWPTDAVRAVAWTVDGEIALSPWLPFPAGGAPDIGDLRLRPRDALTDAEDRAFAEQFGRYGPSSAGPPPPPGPDPEPEDAALAVRGVVRFEGVPVTWTPDGHRGPERRTGRLLLLYERDVTGIAEDVHGVHIDGRFAFTARRPEKRDLWVHVETDLEPWDGPVPADTRVRVRVPEASLTIDLPRAVIQPVVARLPPGTPETSNELTLVCTPLDRGPDGVRYEMPLRRTALRLREGARYALLARVRCGPWSSARRLAPVRIAELTPSATPLVLPMSDGESLTGRVVREDGSPVVGARVRVACGAKFDVETDAWTRLDGSFTVHGLERGTVRVDAAAPGLAAQVERSTGPDPEIVVVHPSEH